MTRNARWLTVAMLAAGAAGLGQAEVVPEPWRHYVTMAGVIGSLVSSLNAHWPRRQAPRPLSRPIDVFAPPVDVRPGDILLYTGKGLYGRIIALKTWHPIAHCEVYIGHGWSVASRDGIGTGTYPLRVSELAMVCRPRAAFPFDLDRAKALHAARAHRGYGWLDLVQFIGIGIQTNGIVCSPFIAEFLRSGGLDLFNGEAGVRIAPFQFALSPYVENLPVFGAVVMADRV